jgi:Ca2+-binding EF-hand superfamily protein
VTEEVIEALFIAFDSDKNGLIDYDEFLGVMRGSLTGARLSVVE